jgi:hypothetical protein
MVSSIWRSDPVRKFLHQEQKAAVFQFDDVGVFAGPALTGFNVDQFNLDGVQIKGSDGGILEIGSHNKLLMGGGRFSPLGYRLSSFAKNAVKRKNFNAYWP